MASTLHQRLLQDIAELQSKPYPNISLHVQDEDMRTACLILDVPESYGKMHLTVTFPSNYPLAPPQVQMNSQIKHPNIFGSYICASILNTKEGYTPAYTLKGIAIQLLSFFSSDKIEQSGGTHSVGLDGFKDCQKYILDRYTCSKCRFNLTEVSKQRLAALPPAALARSRMLCHALTAPPSLQDTRSWPTPREATSSSRKHLADGTMKPIVPVLSTTLDPQSPTSGPAQKLPKITSETPSKAPFTIENVGLPDEILLMICEDLDFEELMAFAQAWQKVGSVITKFDVIRTRELQCFCLKKDYANHSIKLGVGVSVTERGFFESEFDLLSQEAFDNHHVRRSVQGVPFQFWLPLPISYGHWRKVQDDVTNSLKLLVPGANLGVFNRAQVIYQFMNDVVVKLNQLSTRSTRRAYPPFETAKSTLTHASEKAIESYFHLFHLLLCIATADPRITHSANAMLNDFIAGKNSKVDCPNLGHLLVASLIADVEMTPAVLKSIIKETITRNVLWMLQSNPELAYMEPTAFSPYRLKTTFAASKTSYRLLMFLNLFRKTAVGSPRKPLESILHDAFERHGAPPRGSASKLAALIKKIHNIDNFPEFLDCMGIERPTGTSFTQFLRDCVEESTRKGYSSMPIDQAGALWFRLKKEPKVEVKNNLVAVEVNNPGKSFFPGRGGNQVTRGRDGRGGRGGRGRGRGRDRGGH